MEKIIWTFRPTQYIEAFQEINLDFNLLRTLDHDLLLCPSSYSYKI